MFSTNYSLACFECLQWDISLNHLQITLPECNLQWCPNALVYDRWKHRLESGGNLKAMRWFSVDFAELQWYLVNGTCSMTCTWNGGSPPWYDDMLSLNVKRDVQRLDRSCFEKKTSDANSVFDMTKRFAAPIVLWQLNSVCILSNSWFHFCCSSSCDFCCFEPVNKFTAMRAVGMTPLSTCISICRPCIIHGLLCAGADFLSKDFRCVFRWRSRHSLSQAAMTALKPLLQTSMLVHNSCKMRATSPAL